MRLKSLSIVLAVLSSLLAFDAVAQVGVPFQAACTLPFVQIAVQQDIDLDCGPAGLTSNTKSQIQNRAKNNFCATGTPTLVTVAETPSAAHHSSCCRTSVQRQLGRQPRASR